MHGTGWVPLCTIRRRPSEPRAQATGYTPPRSSRTNRPVAPARRDHRTPRLRLGLGSVVQEPARRLRVGASSAWRALRPRCVVMADQCTFRSRPDGPDELSHAVDHLHDDLLRTRLRSLWEIRLPPADVRRAERRDRATDLVSSLDAILPLWPLRVVMAVSDLLAIPAVGALKRYRQYPTGYPCLST